MLRALMFIAGCTSVALAIAGVFLPLVPCTPFAILAAVCFARSSPLAMQRLHRSPLLGSALKDWERHRGLRVSAKIPAACLAVSAPVITYVLYPGFSVMLCISSLAAAVALVVICRLKTIWPGAKSISPPAASSQPGNVA